MLITQEEFLSIRQRCLTLQRRPKANSSSTDFFDSDTAPMKHHRTHHRSFSPPFEVLKQIGVVDSAAYELLDYGEQEDDMVDYDHYSDLPKVTGLFTQAGLFVF